MVIKTNFGTRQATEANMGLVKFASEDEIIAGISTNTVVNPKGIKSAINSINGLIYDVTLLSTNWVGTTAPYTYTINSITGITANTNMHTILSSNININQLSAFQEAMIVDGGLDTDTIIFKALGIKPTVNIPLKIIVSKSLYIEDDYEPQYEVETLPRATTDIYGTVRLATPLDVEEATNDIRVITPFLLGKNVANGVAGLDANLLIDDSFISDNIARLVSPTLTGTPTAPTAEVGTNTEQLATTEFVNNSITNVDNTYTMIDNQTIVDISDIWIDTNYKLTVYINRLYSIENVHYIKNTMNKTITLTNTSAENDLVTVIVRPI